MEFDISVPNLYQGMAAYSRRLTGL
ncbi:hypothetical protein S40285_09208 [Stachybotrys chlorohalonatus IBT 40285]|uniref:Uncharacterized protein n=1 Tax=Stachybotrys chlorohalonatus (strain IBT 40285) TaxID=1283841 RepID=A0A084QYN8_STAC4|nr:hypothetical protein S40285_09208 [Stachybotrys chlorohalonata IBT 40285]